MLSDGQRIRMVAKMREMRTTGRPEEAAKIKAALNAGEYDLGDDKPASIEIPNRPPVKGPGSNVKAWREYAAAASDFDPEIIEATKTGDLILMLEAHDL